MATAADYVTQDEHGILRVGQTRVMLDSVLASFGEGCSAETIVQQYPSLSLEEVYGAITYYLAHRQSVDAYLTQQGTAWAEARASAEQSASPLVTRLREEAIRAGLRQR